MRVYNAPRLIGKWAPLKEPGFRPAVNGLQRSHRLDDAPPHVNYSEVAAVGGNTPSDAALADLPKSCTKVAARTRCVANPGDLSLRARAVIVPDFRTVYLQADEFPPSSL